MLGGARQSLDKVSESDMKSWALDALREHMNIRSEPSVVHTSVAWNCIPQYEIGHKDVLREIEEDVANISSDRIKLLGTTFNGVGIADCIATAESMAREVVLQWSEENQP